MSALTMGGGSPNPDMNFGAMMGMSDRRLKEHVVRIGTHPLGIGLYLFDFMQPFRARWGSGRQFGVMADEVKSVLPAAVSIDSSGYKVVNYAMLGIRHRVS